jgi:transcriptional repressor NrdR
MACVECPSCQAPSRVLESRRAEAGAALRRRRECTRCGDRFTTYERRERPALFVRKRDGRREPFDRGKLRSGMLRAAYKRPATSEQIDAIADRIEAEVEAAGGELDGRRVGELCLAGLGEVDRVSYLQFASVYRQLEDVDDIQAELRRLRSGTRSARRPEGARTARPRAPIPSDPDVSITSPPRRGRRAGTR